MISLPQPMLESACPRTRVRPQLVLAHYADAIPLDLLKSEQDRIRASLDQITTRLDNLTDTYAEARTGLDQLTELLVNLDDLYNKCEPAERRILNGALFTRITIDDEENTIYTPEQTTASVLAHTSIDAPAHVTAETKLPRHQAGQASIFSSYVELGGFEPPTSSMPWKRATNCAIAPSNGCRPRATRITIRSSGTRGQIGRTCRTSPSRRPSPLGPPLARALRTRSPPGCRARCLPHRRSTRRGPSRAPGRCAAGSRGGSCRARAGRTNPQGRGRAGEWFPG